MPKLTVEALQSSPGGGMLEVTRIRVPGGWVYLISRPSNLGFNSVAVFVPLTGKPEEDALNDKD